MGARTLVLHKCAREGCNNLTKNKMCCSKECSALNQVRVKPGPPKKCQKCGLVKPGEDFIHRTPKGVWKPRVWCKECCAKLPQDANVKRAATVAAKHQKRRQMASDYIIPTAQMLECLAKPGERDMASEVLSMVPYSALWRGKGMTTAYSPLINADVFVGY